MSPAEEAPKSFKPALRDDKKRWMNRGQEQADKALRGRIFAVFLAILAKERGK
jgi:hypothetical protein